MANSRESLQHTPPTPARKAPAVGGQVRHWRGRRGLTLAQVAEASGLNVGYLSQIENDKASPSLEALGALAAAIDVPLPWLFLDWSPAPRVVRAEERRRWEGPGGVLVEEVDGGRSRDIRIVMVTSEPGLRTGMHAHPGDEHHIILAGRLRLTQGDTTVELGAGDYLVWDASAPHDAESIGDEPAVVLLISHRTLGAESTDPRTPER